MSSPLDINKPRPRGMTNMSTWRETIAAYNGTVVGGINWTWAKFLDDGQGKACLDQMRRDDPTLEDRGYYDADPEAQNPNLRLGGFRFR